MVDDTDDVREAPAVYVAGKVMAQGATVNAFDPAAMDEAKKAIDRVNYFKNSYDACKDADLVIICTEWNEFRDLNLSKIKELMRTPNLYDTRNIYDPTAVRKLGFTYISTGRP